MIQNVYVQNQHTSKIHQAKINKLQGEIDKSTTTDRNFNTPLSITDRTSRQKISKDTLELNNGINILDLTDIYRLLQQTAAEYTFFSSAHRTFTKIDHIPDHKLILSQFKGTQGIKTMLSDYNGMK